MTWSSTLTIDSLLDCGTELVYAVTADCFTYLAPLRRDLALHTDASSCVIKSLHPFPAMQANMHATNHGLVVGSDEVSLLTCWVIEDIIPCQPHRPQPLTIGSSPITKHTLTVRNRKVSYKQQRTEPARHSTCKLKPATPRCAWPPSQSDKPTGANDAGPLTSKPSFYFQALSNRPYLPRHGDAKHLSLDVLGPFWPR